MIRDHQRALNMCLKQIRQGVISCCEGYGLSTNLRQDIGHQKAKYRILFNDNALPMIGRRPSQLIFKLQSFLSGVFEKMSRLPV